MRAAIAAGVLLSGCAAPVGSVCGTDAGSSARARTWSDPVEVLDRYDGPSFSELGDLEVVGNAVWFCTSVQGLQVYDATSPGALRKLDDIAPTDGSQSFPRCQHLSVADDGRVYVTNRTNSISRASFIAVIDGSDPTNLRELGSIVTDDNVEGSTVAGDRLWVAAHDGGLIAFARGEGAELTELGRLTDLSNPWTVRVDGPVAYVADGAGGLAVVDASDPAAMSVIARLDVGGAVKDLELDGDRLWLAAGTAGVAVVDVSTPSAPVLLDQADTPGSTLAVARGDGFVVGSDWNDLRVFDSTDPDRLVPLGREPVTLRSGKPSRTLGVAASGTAIFSGNWTELVSYRFHPDGAAPDAVFSPRSLTLPLDDAPRGLLRLSNDGTEPLSIEGWATNIDGLAAAELDDLTELAAGEEQTVVVSYDGARDQFDGWAALLSDDPDQPRACVDVRLGGQGVVVGETASPYVFAGALGGDSIALESLRGQVVLLAYFATF